MLNNSSMNRSTHIISSRARRALTTLISLIILSATLTVNVASSEPIVKGFDASFGEGVATQSARSTRLVRSTRPAPAFSLKDADGNTHSLSDFGSRYVLIDFWAPWCPPCVMTIPALNVAQRRYERNLTVIGITDSSWSDIDRVHQRYEMNYLVLRDPQDSVAKSYKVNGIPHLVLVHEGKIIAQFAGYHSASELMTKLARYL